MPINFPVWVTNDTPIPAGFEVRAKKLIYIFAACEKLRRLHNAGWEWHRGDPLTAEEEVLLQAAFPQLWPTPPTEAQVRNWIENYWQPRNREAHHVRAQFRQSVTNAQLNLVDLDGLI